MPVSTCCKLNPKFSSHTLLLLIIWYGLTAAKNSIPPSLLLGLFSHAVTENEFLFHVSKPWACLFTFLLFIYSLRDPFSHSFSSPCLWTKQYYMVALAQEAGHILIGRLSVRSLAAPVFMGLDVEPWVAPNAFIGVAYKWMCVNRLMNMLHKALWVQKRISEPVHLIYSLWMLWVGAPSLESLAVMICIIILHTAKHLGVEPAAMVDEVVYFPGSNSFYAAELLPLEWAPLHFVSPQWVWSCWLCFGLHECHLGSLL